MVDFKIFFFVSVTILCLQFTPNRSYAQYFTGPVSVGAGGTGRAGTDPLEGAFLNPATLSQLNHYYIGTYYTDSSGITQNRHRDFSVMVSDSTPDKLWPMAFAYTKRRITDPGQGAIDQKDYYIALSDFVISRLSFGIGLHRLESEVAGQDFNQHNFHLGMLFTPTTQLGFGLVLYDVAGAGSDVPEAVKLRQTLGFGASYMALNFVKFRLDWTMAMRDNPDKNSKLMLGVESQIHEFFAVRMGSQWDDETKQTFLSAGFSFTGPRLVAAYAFQKEVQPAGGGHKHLFDLYITF